MIGRVVKGKYKIYDRVGTGGFATVYLGRNLETNEIVAIKVLSTQVTGDSEYVERFRREAALVERLQHRNIVRVLDHGREDDEFFTVMEFVEGLTLDRVLERKGRLSLEEALSYAEQTCAGLEAAYQAGIVHRDIKPANLMITPGGRVKIMDFGIALFDSASGITQTGAFLGTPRYISPEMARGGRADIRSDLYSLGLILYEMLSGVSPFDAESPWAIMKLQLETDPTPLHEQRPDVPPWLEAIVVKAMSKDPAARYQTPAEMLAALREQTAVATSVAVGAAAALPTGAAPIPAEEPREGDNKGLIVGLLVAATVVIIMGLVAVLTFGLGDPTASPTSPPTVVAALAASDTPTPAPTATARIIIITGTPEDTRTPEPTVTHTPTPLPTDTDVPSPTPSPLPTETELPTSTPTPEPTDTPQPTVAPTRGPTRTPRPTKPPANTATPVAPPVSGRIAFSAGDELHLVHAATGVDTIDPVPHMRQPDLRADGMLLVANGEGGGFDGLWTIEANTGGLVREQSGFSNDFRPSWSPDGGQIVYDSLHMGRGNHNLYKNVLDSKDDEFLFAGSMAIIGTSPVWMHDDWIAFTACDYWVSGDKGGGSKCGIYRMPSWNERPIMTKPGNLTMRATDNYGPNLVYMSQETGNWEVYLTPAHGGESRNLSNNPDSQDGLGTFSPDGKMVAFVSNRGGPWAVWAVKLDGTGLTRLFNLPDPLTGDWTQEKISWGP